MNAGTKTATTSTILTILNGFDKCIQICCLLHLESQHQVKLAHPLKTPALKPRKQAHLRELRRCQLLYLHHPILLKDQATVLSVSNSLSQTRKLLSALSEFLHHPDSAASAGKKRHQHQLLTSKESLTMLLQKAKKKQELEEAKERRKQERTKSERNRRKARLKRRRGERKNKSKDKSSLFGSQLESSKDGVQSNEINSDECARCFGLYEDDLSPTGKLEKDWVQCTNHACQKWMHAECLRA